MESADVGLFSSKDVDGSTDLDTDSLGFVVDGSIDDTKLFGLLAATALFFLAGASAGGALATGTSATPSSVPWSAATSATFGATAIGGVVVAAAAEASIGLRRLSFVTCQFGCFKYPAAVKMYMCEKIRYGVLFDACDSGLSVIPPSTAKPSPTTVVVCMNRASGSCDGGSTTAHVICAADHAHVSF